MKPGLTLYRVLFLLLMLVIVLGCVEKDAPAPTASSDTSTVDPTSTGSPLTSSSNAAASASALEAMQIIEEQVSGLRGLETLEPVAKAFLNTDELRQRMIEDVEEDYSQEKAREDVLLYAAFEFMEPDAELYYLLIDLYTEQVAGFYDPDTKEMYVVKNSEEPGAMERMVYSHEYTHVLQDQHHDLKAMGFTEEGDGQERDSEQRIAIRSLVEGDASLLMQQYAVQYFDVNDIQEALSQLGDVETGVIDSAPRIVRESMLFPYEQGLLFVSSLFSEGGWQAVNAAYVDPPLSTEQILHPERYPDDVPQIVTLPPLTDTLGLGWHLVDEDVLGEFGLQLYLETHVDPSEAETAAKGWGGDRYAVHWRDDESGYVLALRSVWDSSTDAAEFFDMYTQFAENRFKGGPTRREGDTHLFWVGDDALLLARNGQDETLVLIAPDEETLEAVYALFPSF